MNARYVLTQAAEGDLRSIIRYTRRKWGDEQVRSYLGKLERGIIRLATGSNPFKDVSGLYPGLRMARCEHHYVFCLPREEVASVNVV
ncbi:type II toxin-antitoxin system RelE/ParE family toxin [Novosphingobium resinovorum]|uniref:type II toxin-antitoxin system RelE/ParE family toxin n=1 Tax=Novosphingobium TaxID=165696 RepID=UPI001B3C7519|nr:MULTISPECIES: type II toxin-antitoxin system RelE/ParE family toxin [Novosphingobium]MBF7013761.1 type II toxin-antitoxin system RelE/ParE family toxin [Novosphingobium sp. HR1a]WJM25901.1 type II toxin-antitoxin system RelE/ParE family toxin [Novosphingobium resinovorum]